MPISERDLRRVISRTARKSLPEGLRYARHLRDPQARLKRWTSPDAINDYNYFGKLLEEMPHVLEEDPDLYPEN